MPSLQQLNDAVMAFIGEHPDSLITVVVDATFGHRINSSEVAEFDAAVSNNELVAPPAGAIGRGDAFLLSVANKVGATVLSNDSFQEFHGTYPWLFEDGRLIGGKPVPHIGWVFVARSPVRGPISRSSVKEARRKKDGGPVTASASSRGGERGKREKRQPSPQASQPMPVPKAPPPGATIAAPRQPAKPTASVKQASTADAGVNEFTSFLSFIEHHPVGTSVNATVESYSSHGAYVRLVGGVTGYVPLRLMAEPPPRSAREFLKIGDSVTLVVESFAPARRSIDLAITSMATAKPPAPAKRTRKAAPTPAAAKPSAAEKPAAAKPAKKRAAKSAATKASEQRPTKAAKGTDAAPTAAARKRGSAKVVPDPAAAALDSAKRTRSDSRSKRTSPDPPPAPPASAAPTRRARKAPSTEPAAESAAVIDDVAAPSRRRARKASPAS